MGMGLLGNHRKMVTPDNPIMEDPTKPRINEPGGMGPQRRYAPGTPGVVLEPDGSGRHALFGTNEDELRIWPPRDEQQNAQQAQGGTIFGMEPNKFSQFAGGMAAAIAPNTVGGRMGMIASGMAQNSEENKRRDDAVQRQQEEMDYNRDMKGMELAHKIGTNKLFPKQSRLDALNSMVGSLNKYHFKDNPMPLFDDLPQDQEAGDFANRVQAIASSGLAKEKQYEMMNMLRAEYPEMNAQISGMADLYKPESSNETFKTPLPTTDKGWTVSTNNKGVNVVRMLGPDGNAMEEPYDPKKHGFAEKATGEYRTEAAAVAEAIATGKQPPELSGFGMAKLAPEVRAILAERGYDLTSATLDWKAQQKHVQSLNGTQQLRLRQAVSFAYDSLDLIEDLNKQWKAGQFPPLNKLQLQAAMNGVLGKDAQIIATKLNTQITDLASELGTVYKGGNSSTDESLKMAAENLKSEWSEEQLQGNIDLVRQNLKIRKNSIESTLAAGVVGDRQGRSAQSEGSQGSGESQKQIARTGIEKSTGRKVIEYTDGSREYAQ